MNGDIIRAFTPLVLAFCGVGMTVFGMTGRVDENKFNTASNIAFALIGGATGAAQQGRMNRQPREVSEETDNARG